MNIPALSQSVWDACGNIIGVVELDSARHKPHYSCENDIEMRRYLSAWGRQYQCDSIMLLSASDHAHVHAEVFEPNAGTDALPGGISSMCGNGIRAVGAFLKSKRVDSLIDNTVRISTKSGVREVVALQSDYYSCQMGIFTESDEAVDQYRTHLWHNEFSDLCTHIQENVGAPLIYHGMGLSGTPNGRKAIDGEPHVVLVFDSTMYQNVEQVRSHLIHIGSLITKNTRLFPHEVNTNIIFIQRLNKEMIEIYIMTFERNLGNDPQRSITKSCGTGATAAAGVLHQRLGIKDESMYLINTMGGQLKVLVDKHNVLHLQGKAVRIS